MNKKPYEAPDMIKRVLSTESIAASMSGDDNVNEPDSSFWTE